MRRGRVLPATALLLWAAVLLGGGTSAFGASPPEGQLDRETTTFGWAGDPYETTDPVDPATCPVSSDPDDAICDHVLLTMDVSERFWERHDGGVEIAIDWDSPADDFDLYVYDEAGALVASSATHGLRTPAEVVALEEPIGLLEIRVVPISVAGVGYRGAAALTFERAPEPKPEPQEPDPDPAPEDEQPGERDPRPRDRTDADQTFGAFGGTSSDARAFDSRAFGQPSSLQPSEASTASPAVPSGEPPSQVFLPPAPVDAVATSAVTPPRPTPALLVAAAAALALTALAVFDRLPREDRPHVDGTAPEPPTG